MSAGPPSPRRSRVARAARRLRSSAPVAGRAHEREGGRAGDDAGKTGCAGGSALGRGARRDEGRRTRNPCGSSQSPRPARARRDTEASACGDTGFGLGETRVSEREVGLLYRAWRHADATGKQRIVSEPLLCLRALQAAASGDEDDESASLLKDLTTLAAIAWRARRRVHVGGGLTADHIKAWRAAANAFASLAGALKEIHAGPDDSLEHPDAA